MPSINILSDLHLEVDNFYHSPPKCDFIVLAGDIWNFDFAKTWISRQYPNNNVIYIAGNHEFWKSEIDYLNFKLRQPFPKQENSTGQHAFLQNSSKFFEKENVLFIGSTLWTNYELYGTPQKSMLEAQVNINDFYKTKYGNDWLKPQDTLEFHEQSIAYISEEIQATRLRDPTTKIIVVTHMAPSKKSIHKMYKDSPINAYYASDLESFILKHQPNLWIHGHMHNSFDYKIGKTRVICNPRGYYNENPKFNPNLVVDI